MTENVSDRANPGDPGDPPASGAHTKPVDASRREVFRWLGAAAAVVGAGGAFVTATPAQAAASRRLATDSHARLSTAAVNAPLPAASPAASTFAPLRPPATPLAVRSPYLSTWQASDTLTGTWSTFWNGHITALCGIARIDGAGWLFAGAPSSSIVAEHHDADLAAAHRDPLDVHLHRRRGTADGHVLLAGGPEQPATAVRAVQLRQSRRPAPTARPTAFSSTWTSPPSGRTAT